MSRIVAVGFGAILMGLIIGAAAMKLWPAAPVPSAIAVVDLAGIVERQRADVLQKGKYPQASEQMMQERMIRLATILAGLGQKQVILNKAAIVSGTIPDLTEQVEERLSSSGATK